MKRRTLDEHFFDIGPKRILTLDGGGIRGALTLGFLKRIEDILRRRVGDDPDFRLCDYFDLIGGDLNRVNYRHRPGSGVFGGRTPESLSIPLRRSVQETDLALWAVRLKVSPETFGQGSHRLF